jgi:hypothetical protein
VSYSGSSRNKKVECRLDLSVAGEGQMAELCDLGNETSDSVKCGVDFLTS